MKRRQLFTVAATTLLTGLVGLAGLAASMSPGIAFAQTDRPLKILIGVPPGGSLDAVARLLADKMKDELKRPVIVESKPGAGTRLAAELLKNAPPDGDTVMIAPIVVPVLAPLTFSKLNYNPAVDFAPVVHVANFHFGLAVPAEAPYKTLPEFIAWLKASPAKANFGMPAAGSLPHFFGLMIGREAGVDIVPVPFQGGAPLLTALAGNQVASGIDVLGEQLELAKAGKIRILASSGAQRSKLAPDVPTFKEIGFANIQAQGWYAMYAPARTPAAALGAINAAANKAMASPDVIERYAKLLLETGGGSSGDLVKLQEADSQRWAPIIKASGFKAD
jgi:tripartite-type tricarboxylate transporter receptor subunit TctC